MKTRIIFLIGSFFFIGKSESQNLVPNPSFENNQYVPCGIMTNSSQFNLSVDSWSVPNNGTTDLYTTLNNSSCSNNCFSTNSQSIGSQQPRSGDYMACISTFGWGCYGVPGFPNYREYLQVELSSPLMVGETYYAECYVSLAEYYAYASNNIGMLFTTNQVHENSCFQLNYLPQINENTVITDSLNWVKISGTFIATEPYRYLTIGNMYGDDLTDTINIDPNFPFRTAFYFVDDVLVENVACENSVTNIRFCSGDSISLVNNSSGNFLGWANSNSPESIISTSSILEVNPAQGVTYYSYTDCDTAIFNLYYYQSPEVDLGPDTLGLCSDDSVELNAYYSTESNYNWNITGWNDAIHYAVDEGNYIVEVEEFGCKSSDSIYLIENPFGTFQILDDKSACIGDTVELYAQIPYESDFIWFDGDTSSLYKSILENGSYGITVTKFGCNEIDFSDIYFYSNPELNLGNDTIMCNDFTLEYNLTQDGSIVWDNGSTDFVRSIAEEGLYWATLASDQGCISSDTIFISTLDCETEIMLPNIFTPNNDGVNDKFVPIITKNVFSPLLSIYNRWGNKVFYTTNLDNGWNGNILETNEYCPTGTYFWVIEYEDFFSIKQSIKGEVYLSK